MAPSCDGSRSSSTRTRSSSRVTWPGRPEMLDLRPPWFLINGVLCAPDTVDETQYYFFPSSPHLARSEDGRPAVRLMVYRERLSPLPPGEDEAAGFLVLDTSLDWPPETLADVARKLRTQRGLSAP